MLQAQFVADKRVKVVLQPVQVEASVHVSQLLIADEQSWQEEFVVLKN